MRPVERTFHVVVFGSLAARRRRQRSGGGFCLRRLRSDCFRGSRRRFAVLLVQKQNSEADEKDKDNETAHGLSGSRWRATAGGTSRLSPIQCSVKQVVETERNTHQYCRHTADPQVELVLSYWNSERAKQKRPAEKDYCARREERHREKH